MQLGKTHLEKALKPTTGPPLKNHRCSPACVTGWTRCQEYHQRGPTHPHRWSEVLVSLWCPALPLAYFPLPTWGPLHCQINVMCLHPSYKVAKAKSSGLSKLCI